MCVRCVQLPAQTSDDSAKGPNSQKHGTRLALVLGHQASTFIHFYKLFQILAPTTPTLVPHHDRSRLVIRNQGQLTILIDTSTEDPDPDPVPVPVPVPDL